MTQWSTEELLKALRFEAVMIQDVEDMEGKTIKKSILSDEGAFIALCECGSIAAILIEEGWDHCYDAYFGSSSQLRMSDFLALGLASGKEVELAKAESKAREKLSAEDGQRQMYEALKKKFGDK